jgi:hypothetical protein
MNVVGVVRGKSQTGSGVFIVRKFVDISEKILPRGCPEGATPRFVSEPQEQPLPPSAEGSRFAHETFFQDHMIEGINPRGFIVDLNIARCKTHLSSVVTVNSLSQQSFYHTFSHNRTTHPISPEFISSYSDEKCSFKVKIKKNNGKFFVWPLFQIKSHSRDNLLLMRIKDYFGGIGNIFTSSNNSIFVVRSLDLIKILMHFDCYPLKTYKKAADFILFKQIVLNTADGEHLSLKGFQKIVNIRASMNSGLSPWLKASFPNTVPVTRPLIPRQATSSAVSLKGPARQGGPTSRREAGLKNVAKFSTTTIRRLAHNHLVTELVTPPVLNTAALETRTVKSVNRSGILELNGLSLQSDLIEWLRGFTDGEGCFFIDRQGNKVYFVFTVQLHKDDAPLLLRLRDHFKIGKVSFFLNKVSWICKNKKEVRVIIDIFSKNPLNTTKHLNFLIWKEAFELYTNRTGKSCSGLRPTELMTKVLVLKNEMNNKRTNFNMPSDHTIRITDYWLLGFVEGEGSFFVLRNKRIGLGFAISQAIIDKAVMIKIKKFLLTLASSDPTGAFFNKLKKLDLTNPNKGELVYLNDIEPPKDSSYHEKCVIKVENEEFILKVLIPFFDKLTFYSKKALDYQDFRTIARIKEKGLHHTDEGKALITKISSQMNQRRLSTNNKSIVVDREGLLAEIDYILALSSIYETRDGRKFNLINQKFENRGRAGSSVAIISDDGSTILKEFSSMTDCAKELGVPRHVVVHKLKSIYKQCPLEYKGKLCTIKFTRSSGR